MIDGRGRGEPPTDPDGDNLMAPPRNPPIPRFAPGGCITLHTALDMIGSAVDPAWTGEEIESDAAPEPSDEDLDKLVFARVLGQVADKPRSEVEDDNPSEAQIRAALHKERDLKFAARRRWQATGIWFMRYLHQGMLKPSAMGNDGKLYEVPAHLWAAEHAECLFDNGGCLEVRAGQLAVARGPVQAEDTAIVLINKGDLEGIIEAIKEGNVPPTVPPAVTEVQQVDPARTGYPGAPSLRRAIETEFRRRIKAGEHETTIKAQGEALHRWADETYPSHHIPTAKTIQTHIRSPYNTLVRRTQ
jgi:hypothetical protein